MIIKNIVILLFYIMALFCSYCYGQNEDITLNFKIKKKDVGKIEFRTPEKKCRAKNDMTSVIDSMWYVDDTLYVTYMQQTYQDSTKYHDGDTIYMRKWTAQYAPLNVSFIQQLSVPIRPEHICLNNGSHIFYFKRVSLQEYQLVEYHPINSTAQNRIQWHLYKQDSIKPHGTAQHRSSSPPIYR